MHRSCPGRPRCALLPVPVPAAGWRPGFGNGDRIHPTDRSEALRGLADDCVTAFDRFRRPAEVSELARRRSAGLSQRQHALLARFGYPYVLDEFRFHLTLTERLQPDDSRVLKPWLERHFAAALREPIVVTDLCLFVQERPDAPFCILQRFSLRTR